MTNPSRDARTANAHHRHAMNRVPEVWRPLMVRVFAVALTALFLLAGCGTDQPIAEPKTTEPPIEQPIDQSTEQPTQPTTTELPTQPKTAPTLEAEADGTSAAECDPLKLIREALDGREWLDGYIDKDSALAHTVGGVTLHVGCGDGPYEFNPEHWEDWTK